jgi:predicted nucleic acid-binding protein
VTADFPVVLDACVLANSGVCDLLLRLAEHPRLYKPRWSEKILTEVKRTHLRRLKWPKKIAESWQREVRANFPEASVTGYEPLVSKLRNHKKDRHVLAAAIKGHAQLIVTFNLKDFPEVALAPWGVEVAHPEEYLLTLYEMHPAVVMGKISAISRKYDRDLEKTVLKLGISLKLFASKILEDMGTPTSREPAARKSPR